MFINSEFDKDTYVSLMSAFKEGNQSLKTVEASREYHMGLFLKQIKGAVLHPKEWSEIVHIFDGKIRWQRVLKKYPNKEILSEKSVDEPINYFSDKRFVVYTSVFGDYDYIQEPLFCPDNCDFYFIGDTELPENSKWNRYDLSKIENDIKNLNNPERNRFCKMFPYKLFPEYEFSIYIDGNITPVTDLTEFINFPLPCGIGMHYHKSRDCVYEEADACGILKKLPRQAVSDYVKYLSDNGFPKKYGMTECNFIVRQHLNITMRKIMEEWWYQFLNFVKRDQLSFPFVLWKNGIDISEIAVLGNNVFNNPAIRVTLHK